MMNIIKQENCYIKEIGKAYNEGYRLYIYGGVATHASYIKKFF